MKDQSISELALEVSRADLRTLVESVGRNPYSRYVLTTREGPTAVVLSFRIYKVMERALGKLLAAEENLSKEEAMREAFDSTAEEHWPEVRGRSLYPAHQAAVSAGRGRF